ncbi:MAG: 1-deoxy-D-xylulose-5-phosphate reductoisomerase [Phycisphaerae bacterium]|nr:1-deoxy-D-xylulose-5-phosphate reductoisomerase [Phycisphaerae bacterium]
MADKRIAILGSTGSIGRQALEVISGLEGMGVCALAAGENWELLAEQAAEFSPDAVAIAADEGGEILRSRLADRIAVLTGPDAMTELVRSSRPDVLLTAVVGAAGLSPTLAGIECGSALAIANKETLVMAGAVVMPAARKAGVRVVPVDSEHSAIFQCLAAGDRSELRRVVITASGGALRGWSPEAAENAAVEDVLNHPTWEMGPKITVDSATLINKALEIVEAHWLFDLASEQIEVVLHDESIVHSYVEFCDGSVIAQMGLPDMATPIAYALCYPDRPLRATEPLDLAEIGTLTFRRLEGRFARAVNLGYEAIRRGPGGGAALNGANEAAVRAFLAGEITFGKIVPLVEDILNRAPAEGGEQADLSALVAADSWARREVARAVSEP